MKLSEILTLLSEEELGVSDFADVINKNCIINFRTLVSSAQHGSELLWRGIPDASTSGIAKSIKIVNDGNEITIEWLVVPKSNYARQSKTGSNFVARAMQFHPDFKDFPVRNLSVCTANDRHNTAKFALSAAPWVVFPFDDVKSFGVCYTDLNFVRFDSARNDTAGSLMDINRFSLRTEIELRRLLSCVPPEEMSPKRPVNATEKAALEVALVLRKIAQEYPRSESIAETLEPRSREQFEKMLGYIDEVYTVIADSEIYADEQMAGKVFCFLRNIDGTSFDVNSDINAQNLFIFIETFYDLYRKTRLLAGRGQQNFMGIYKSFSPKALGVSLAQDVFEAIRKTETGSEVWFHGGHVLVRVTDDVGVLPDSEISQILSNLLKRQGV